MNKGASKRISGGLDQQHGYNSGGSDIYLSHYIAPCETNCISCRVAFFGSLGYCNPVVGRIASDSPRIHSINTMGVYLVYKES